MAVFKNFKDDELIVSCKCGCDEGIHFKIHDYGDGDYAFLSYTNGNFYTQQRPFFEKLKKIWAIIWNKDFYYSDVVLTKDDFKEFKEWIIRKQVSKIIGCLIIIAEIIITLFIGLYIACKADNENIYILNSLNNYIVELFKDRNIFGKILSSFIFVLSIPGMLFILLMVIADTITKYLIKIWKLGNK